jgi:hypothetical protein
VTNGGAGDPHVTSLNLLVACMGGLSWSLSNEVASECGSVEAEVLSL